MNTMPKRRWRWLALILSFAVIASIAGLLVSLRGESRAQPVTASPSTPGSGPGSTQARADLSRMQALLNTGSVSKQAGVLVPGSRFAPGSGPIFRAGTTITIKQETFRSEPGSDGQEYGTVQARLSSGQADTLGLVADQDHWYLYDVTPGTAQASASVTYGGAAPDVQLDSSPAPGGLVPSGSQIGTRTPVIFIHGWTGNSTAFGNDGEPDSMYAQVDSIPGTWVWSWNYGPTSTRWVTNPGNGPAFAQYIYNMHEASLAGHGSGKVIIVAYSMGGLLTRYATGQVINKNHISDDIAMVITIGTPNTGSFYATDLSTIRAVACKIGLGKLPSKALKDFCTQWTALSGMARFGSQVDSLPQIPSNIPLNSIAGSEILDVPLGLAWVLMPLTGDGIVSLSSALAARPGGNQTFTTVTAGQPYDFSALHTQLPSNPRIIADVHSMVLAWIQAHPVQAPAPSPSPSPSAPGNAAYWLANGGQWYVHGVSLQLSQGPSGLTGTETWNEGPCDPANLPGVMCQGSASLAFTSQSNGSLAGTYTTDTTYTPSSGTTVGSFPGDPGAPQKGQTVLLEPITPMHAQSVLGPDSPMMFSGGNLNWCQQGLADASQYCGA